MLARFADGRTHLLQGVVGDDSNFFLAEAFDGMQDENLAVGPRALHSASLHQLDEFLARGHLLGIVGMAVGDDVFFEQAVVGLMELESRLVAGLHVRFTVTMLERDFAKFAVAGGDAIDGLAGQADTARARS